MLLSSFEVNRMKAIAVAIKQGADAQRDSHDKQVSRLEVLLVSLGLSSQPCCGEQQGFERANVTGQACGVCLISLSGGRRRLRCCVPSET